VNDDDSRKLVTYNVSNASRIKPYDAQHDRHVSESPSNDQTAH